MGFAQSMPETLDAKYYTEYSLNTFKQLPALHQKIANSKFNYSSALEKAALGHSIDMVDQNFYSHQSPVPDKEDLSDRLKQVGVNFTACAENIYDFNDENPTYWSLASLLVEGWMNSSGHRRNILNPEYKYLGCGAWPYNNPEWPTYKWFKSTQDFSNKDAGQ